MKTAETLELEELIYGATRKLGVFGCFEVTIGFGGTERVDYLTYDTKGIWRCYEIKISVGDFRSKNANTFVGNFNYYVMTQELYDKVHDEIPGGIGVYVGKRLIVKPKRQDLAVDERVLFESMTRSLYREYEKSRESKDIELLQMLERELKAARREREFEVESRRCLANYCYEKFGIGFIREFREWRKANEH